MFPRFFFLFKASQDYRCDFLITFFLFLLSSVNKSMISSSPGQAHSQHSHPDRNSIYRLLCTRYLDDHFTSLIVSPPSFSCFPKFSDEHKTLTLKMQKKLQEKTEAAAEYVGLFYRKLYLGKWPHPVFLL